jgi:uncharacterized protein (TIGR03382 family)
MGFNRVCIKSLTSVFAIGLTFFLPRVANAGVCTLPSDCYSIGQVCNLGLCIPCGANYDDGGLNDPLFACQDPSAPICDIPDGSVGGGCVQCTATMGCDGNEVCDVATNLCVLTDGGSLDASTGDSGLRDASAEDGSIGDGSVGDGSTGDGSAPYGDGSVYPGDGSSGDGSIEAGDLADGSFVEGGGCSCTTTSGNGSMGGAAVACLIALGALARRRKR